jgi:hypothetical protein
MKTIEIEVYNYSELSYNAKDKVKKWIYEGLDYISDEAGKTLDAFFKLFPASYHNVDFNEPYRNDIRVSNNMEGKELFRFMDSIYYSFFKGKHYGKFVNQKYIKRTSKVMFEADNCPLTGMGYDYSILNPILEYYKNPDSISDLSELLSACVDSLCKDIQDEICGRLTDEAIIEHCKANEYFFTESGELA